MAACSDMSVITRQGTGLCLREHAFDTRMWEPTFLLRWELADMWQCPPFCRANTLGVNPTGGLADDERNANGQLQVNGATTSGGVQNPTHITSAEMNQPASTKKASTSSLGSLLSGGSSSSGTTGAAATKTTGAAATKPVKVSTASGSIGSTPHAAGASAGGGGASGSFAAGRRLLREALVRGVAA